MATTRLPADFRDFLKLLHSHRVEYLLVGGYAVCYHGYYRNTVDIDLWIAVNPENATKMTELIREFGFNVPELSPALLSRLSAEYFSVIDSTVKEKMNEVILQAKNNLDSIGGIVEIN